MRQAARVKGGFYAIPPEVMEFIPPLLDVPSPKEVTMCDPCCGEGEGIQQLARAIGVPQRGIYAIELDKSRGEAAKALLGPSANILAPCAFEATQISYHQFSLMYLNPPFDDQLGGGKREELKFFTRATNHLAIGGVMIFVAPITTMVQNEDMVNKIDCNYRDIELFTFPEKHRRFGECIMIGIRRTPILFSDQTKGEMRHFLYRYRYEAPINEPLVVRDRTWTVPPGDHPKTWLKKMFTPEELHEVVVRQSALHELFSTPKELVLPRPPLELGRGHISLLVMCGGMNGTLYRPGEPRFVLRGTIDKKFYTKDYQGAKDGGTTTKLAQQTINNVRCVGNDGIIVTFSNDRATMTT